MRLAELLHREMQARGVKARPLALKAGLGETAVRDILQGKSQQPRRRTLEKIAAALGLPAGYFLDMANLAGPAFDGYPPDPVADHTGGRGAAQGADHLFDAAAGGFPAMPAAPMGIAVKGRLDGAGTLHPLAPGDLREVPLPPGESNPTLLSCYIMDDDSMADTLVRGSYFIVKDIRAGGTIAPSNDYLIMAEGRCYLRQLYQDEAGCLWFIAMPKSPRPGLAAFAANMDMPGAVTHEDPQALGVRDILGRIVYDARLRQ